MPQFLIPADATVFRAGAGLFKAGSIITLPDAASKPGELIPLRLIPLDKEAHALLEKSAEAIIVAREAFLAGQEPPRKMSENEKKEIRAKVRPISAPPEVTKPKDEALTFREAVEGKGSLAGVKGGRAADR